MKKIFLSLVVALMTAGVVNAQDLQSVVDMYNAAAVVLNEGKSEEALNSFNATLTAAANLGDEGAQVVNDCKEIIPKILLQVGKDKAEAKDFDGAVNAFKEAVAKANEFSNNVDVAEEAKNLIPKLMMAEAGQRLSAKDYAGAIAAYNVVVEADSTNGVALLRLGMAQAASGNAEEAIVSLNKAVANGQESAAKKQLSNIYLKKAVACQKAKDFKGMLENAKLSAAENDSPNAQKLIGTSALQLKQNKIAAEAFEAYLALKPNANDKAQTMYQIGTAYVGVGDNAKACSYFKQIVNDAQWGEAAKYQVTVLKCN
jgi:tetratricopeptide (TPR) repeat protein